MNALRRARRAGRGLLDQAYAAHDAIIRHGRAMTRGQLLRIQLETVACELVNAGHPWPLRLRGDSVEELTMAVNMPFGVLAPVAYQVQRLDLRPGDRLVLITDGKRERATATVGLAALLLATRDEHLREVVRAPISAVHEACGGSLPDDAIMLVLERAQDPAR
nr:hypothetical protein StreXyl84_66530 [Streptomyces sp. Xyl84]